jgi:hypothetical protein
VLELRLDWGQGAESKGVFGLVLDRQAPPSLRNPAGSTNHAGDLTAQDGAVLGLLRPPNKTAALSLAMPRKPPADSDFRAA